MTGGLGADTFVWAGPEDWATVTDFNAAESDRPDLSAWSHGEVLPEGMTITQSGADTIVTTNDPAVVTRLDTQLADLAGHVIW